MRLISVIVLVGATAVAAPSMAQQGPELVPPSPPLETETPADADQPEVAELTEADLRAWLDGYMSYALASTDTAGAVVVVVKDGEVLLQEGYGYADVDEEIPVDPETTLFRPGSVSKLFTWTAVMQLVERGKLDIERDVNAYLDFDIPSRDGEPVTLRDLLTHTPGFEERVKGLFLAEAEDIEPLGETLKRWTPERIYPPGQTPAYSNYGTALAGYIVERISGQSFDDYIEQHIFEPLGMEQSSFRQPLPERLQADMSQGYLAASGPEQDYEIVGIPPAGSLAATGADMARFMIAHLQNGRYDSARILEPATARTMHGTPLTMIPPLNRMLLGFYEANINGRRVIAHGGDTQWFHSYLHLFLDDDIGLFASVNSAGKEYEGAVIPSSLFQDFSDRYLPEPPVAESSQDVDAEAAAEHAALMAGLYDNSRRSESSFLSVLNLLGQAKIVANDDGTITVPLIQGLDGEPKQWREVSSFVWREVGGGTRLAAEVEDGEVARLSFDDVSPFMVFEPTPWWKSSAWLLPLLVCGLVALLLTAVLWPVRAIVRRRFGADFPLTGRNALAFRLVRISAVASLVTVATWAGTVMMMSSDITMLSPRFDGWLRVVQIAALIVFPGGAAIACWNVWVVWTGPRSWLAKAWSVVLAVACLAVLWVAVAFELIGFSVNY
ncbi:MAG: beta-lactamase family protein [Gammaproteobacteria bacterium]|nr:beta-lactamase family protein [Gammaproteobacteria bacterium]